MTPPSSTLHLRFFFSSSPHSRILLSSLNRFHNFFNHTPPFLLYFFSSTHFASPLPLFLSSSASFLKDRPLILLESLTRKPHKRIPFERETVGRPKHDRISHSSQSTTKSPKFLSSSVGFFLFLFVSLSLSPYVYSFESLRSRFQHCLKTMKKWSFVPYSIFFKQCLRAMVSVLFYENMVMCVFF